MRAEVHAQSAQTEAGEEHPASMADLPVGRPEQIRATGRTLTLCVQARPRGPKNVLTGLVTPVIMYYQCNH